MKELSKKQIKRQDFVDNAIHEFIQTINQSDKEIDWDMEMTGEVRDVLREWFVIKLKITEEQKFYSSLEEDKIDSNGRR
jgi:hypothetical protein